MGNARSVPGTLPRPLHTFTYLILINGFSSLIHLGGFLVSLNHGVLVRKMGSNNMDGGDGEDEMMSQLWVWP